jgi:hypothetical protein
LVFFSLFYLSLASDVCGAKPKQEWKGPFQLRMLLLMRRDVISWVGTGGRRGTTENN